MAIVIGVDASTQSTTVCARDVTSGEVLAVASAPHPPTSPPRSEQDPSAWWQALVAAVRQAIADEPRVASAAALSVAGQQHGLVVTDHEGAPLRPAKLWNDTESAPQAARLVAEHGAAAWAQRTGVVPVASLTITKLHWLAEHEPDVLARAARVLLPHDWLTAALCGAYVTDRGDASGTGWFDPVAGTWLPELLAEVAGARAEAAWLDALPRVLGPTEAAGELLPAAAEALGLAPGIVVGPGTGDNMAAALGLALAPGDVALSLGTSGTAYAVADAPVHDERGLVAGFADATGRYLPLVCTLNATRVTDTIGALLGLERDACAAAALDAPAGADGVVLVPYLDGERTPDRPDATGTLSGITTATTPAMVARAAHEGVVCGLLDGIDALRSAGVAVDGRLQLIGGGSRSPAYRQVVADLADVPVVVAPDVEHVALGAAVQAAAVLGAEAPLTVARRWAPAAAVVPRSAGVDAAAVRGAYRAAAASS